MAHAAAAGVASLPLFLAHNRLTSWGDKNWRWIWGLAVVGEGGGVDCGVAEIVLLDGLAFVKE